MTALPAPTANRTRRRPIPRPQPRRRRPLPRRRRHTYGITEPGTYASIPAWWSREQWRSQCYPDLHTPAVTALRHTVGRGGPVSVKACWALAHALSACADTDTGRNALPGLDALTAKPTSAEPGELDLTDPAVLTRLRTATGYGKTTIQKASRVLAARGWIVLIRAGKNWLNTDERKELWRASSPARQRRNVWACTIPPHLRTASAQQPPEPLQIHPASARHTPAQPGPVDNSGPQNTGSNPGCTLPTTRRVKWISSVDSNNYFTPEQASKTGAPRRAPTKEHASTPNRTYRADTRVVRLAKDLRARIPWLRDVPHQRIMPSLHRFAVQGWTATDIQTHLDRLLTQRGWTIPGRPAHTERGHTGHTRHRPATTMRSPWGYLAYLLRHIDPTDLQHEQAHTAALDARDNYQHQLIYGPPCPHGQPAGHIPSPTHHILACPLCRRDHQHQTGNNPGLGSGA